MKTSVIIKGQIFSVSALRNVIETYASDTNKLHFNSLEVIFNTKKEAVKALSNAYQSLKDNDCVTYTRGSSISYDAAQAYILEN